MLREQFPPLRRAQAKREHVLQRCCAKVGLSRAGAREDRTVTSDRTLALPVTVTLAHTLPLPQQLHFWEFLPTDVPKCDK